MMFWSWKKVIPKVICETLIQEISNTDLEKSTIVSDNVSQYVEQLRNSRNAWLRDNHWFEGILYNHIRYANKNLGTNYEITGCESVQYTSYEIGQKYDWHMDCDMQSVSEITRKLTAVCQLSDSSDFTGGGLIAKFDNKTESQTLLLEQGDIVVFPSYTLHKALPVESGKRITAVLWATGPYWK